MEFFDQQRKILHSSRTIFLGSMSKDTSKIVSLLMAQDALTQGDKNIFLTVLLHAWHKYYGVAS
jgi:hypothetical protein